MLSHQISHTVKCNKIVNVTNLSHNIIKSNHYKNYRVKMELNFKVNYSTRVRRMNDRKCDAMKIYFKDIELEKCLTLYFSWPNVCKFIMHSGQTPWRRIATPLSLSASGKKAKADKIFPLCDFVDNFMQN